MWSICHTSSNMKGGKIRSSAVSNQIHHALPVYLFTKSANILVRSFTVSLATTCKRGQLGLYYWAIPWWRLWPKFENFSLLIGHSSYNKQAINHFVVDVRSTVGGQSTATPKKINLGQGQAQCSCNARWRLWLRTKVGSASDSLQSPISVKCDRVLCQHLYIWWTTYC